MDELNDDDDDDDQSVPLAVKTFITSVLFTVGKPLLALFLPLRARIQVTYSLVVNENEVV